ncbi:hypothetical protein HGO40_01080 [Pseudomonas sp. CG7]|uniref:hypothetical protein n=1 Tax=Pseudomonas sp. CG7 TaxID=191007 RepID=UPI0020331D06|nr:hypothetical protein [Pseudomonas sp. CG7]MCM2459107.1 hypothetical protein [Pseudomonas sp. CG7]
MSWSSLPENIKLMVLHFLTIEELTEIMFTDQQTSRLVLTVWRDKMSLQTGGDSQGHFLSFDAVHWALSSNSTFRLLAQLPAFIPSQITRGLQIGKGGTNSVYLVKEHPGVLMKDGGAKVGGTSKEYNAMVKMGAMGLRTVLHDLRIHRGRIQIIMDRVNGCVDSKTIIGYKKHLTDYINPDMATPCPRSKDALAIHGETLCQLLSAWDLMFEKGQYFNDFQFLLDPSGEVYLNDPTDVANKFWDRGTNIIIQAIINTYEYIHRIAGEQDWMTFKRYKKTLAERRYKEFELGSGLLPEQFYTPHYTVINYRFCWYQAPSPSTMFRTKFALDVPSFIRVQLAGGMFGYFHQECDYRRPGVYEWAKWNDLLSLI